MCHSEDLGKEINELMLCLQEVIIGTSTRRPGSEGPQIRQIIEAIVRGQIKTAISEVRR
jgi:hypothetical protein